MAKALYDISKLVFGIVVLGPLVSSPEVRVGLVVGGAVAFSVVFVAAAFVDQGR